MPTWINCIKNHKKKYIALFQLKNGIATFVNRVLCTTSKFCSYIYFLICYFIITYYQYQWKIFAPKIYQYKPVILIKHIHEYHHVKQCDKLNYLWFKKKMCFCKMSNLLTTQKHKVELEMWKHTIVLCSIHSNGTLLYYLSKERKKKK